MDPTCSVEGCTSPAFCRGWCSAHYSRWQRHGDPLVTKRPPPRSNRYDGQLCEVDGCIRAARKLGLCNMHYQRQRGTGSAGEAATRRIPRGDECMVEGCSKPVAAKRLCSMHRWRERFKGDLDYPSGYGQKSRTRMASGYIRVYVPDHPFCNTDGAVLEHRIVMECELGRYLEPGESVHHRNGVRDDNRPENLELWVKPQPAGQRVEDLVAWVIDHYPQQVREALSLL